MFETFNISIKILFYISILFESYLISSRSTIVIRDYEMYLDSTSAGVLHSAPMRSGRIGANFSNGYDSERCGIFSGIFHFIPFYILSRENIEKAYIRSLIKI